MSNKEAIEQIKNKPFHEQFNKNTLPEEIKRVAPPSNSNNNTIPNTQDFIKFDSQDTAEMLNEKLLDDIKNQREQEKNEEIQNLAHAQAAIDSLPDKQEGGREVKARNTGVAYFDKLNRGLTLYEALLAKKIGLNPKWEYRKIDFKSDNTTRKVNLNESMRKSIDAIQNAKALIDAQVRYSTATGHNKTALTTLKAGAYKLWGTLGSSDEFERQQSAEALSTAQAKANYHDNANGQAEDKKAKRERYTRMTTTGANTLDETHSSLRRSKEKLTQHLAYLKNNNMPEITKSIPFLEKNLRKIEAKEKIMQDFINIKNPSTEQINKFYFELLR